LTPSTKRALAVATAIVMVAGAVFAGAWNNMATADDTPGPGLSGDTAQSMPTDAIYSAVGRVKYQPPNAVALPGWGTFGGLGEEYRTAAARNAQEANRMFLGWLQSLSETGSRLNSYFPDASFQLGDPKDPMFANWTFDNGSETVESNGRSSSTSPSSGTSYNVTADGSGGVKADYSAKGVVQGTHTSIQGTYTFEAIGMGTSKSYGTLGVNSFCWLWNTDNTLNLNGWANVIGMDNMSVTMGPSSFGIGLTGKNSDGQQVGVSAAVGADGRLLGLSVGGVVNVPGFPAPVNIRVDVNNTGANFSTTPVPGIEVSSNTNGSFNLTMDVNVFGPWFQRVVSGK
jgi:hypothetical protein